MKVKTSELIGPALDWAVAKCEIPNDVRDNRPRFWIHPNNPKLICRETYNHETNPKGYEFCCYSTDWSQGGPITFREGIGTFRYYRLDESQPFIWGAHKTVPRPNMEGSINMVSITLDGPTPLIAAMRCHITCELGYEVEIPDKLMKIGENYAL